MRWLKQLLAGFFDDSLYGPWGNYPRLIRWSVRIVVLGAIVFLGYAAVRGTL